MSDDIVNLGPSVLFNQGGWQADFDKTRAELKLLCEQWQYARPCGCNDDPDWELCDTCEACQDILGGIGPCR